MSQDKTKFEWDATESAPKHYPMKIIQGRFIYRSEAEKGLYIPSGGTLNDGWGKAISSHVTGEKYKPLPDRLKITFFSNAENQFYQGDFKLPYEKILTIFRNGAEVNPEEPTYRRIMVGVAPGGAVAVWLAGSGDYTEVFFSQAEKIELDPSRAFSLPFESKEQSDAYIAKQLVNSLTPEELESLKKEGIPFGLWSRYRNMYDWQPMLSKGYDPDFFNIAFLNGELARRWYNSDKSKKDMTRAVPSRVTFKTVMAGKKKTFIVHFDQFETMAAFEKLGANGKKVYLEFEPKLPKKQTKVRLYNDKESIALMKTDSEEW